MPSCSFHDSAGIGGHHPNAAVGIPTTAALPSVVKAFATMASAVVKVTAPKTKQKREGGGKGEGAEENSLGSHWADFARPEARKKQTLSISKSARGRSRVGRQCAWAQKNRYKRNRHPRARLLYYDTVYHTAPLRTLNTRIHIDRKALGRLLTFAHEYRRRRQSDGNDHRSGGLRVRRVGSCRRRIATRASAQSRLDNRQIRRNWGPLISASRRSGGSPVSS